MTITQTQMNIILGMAKDIRDDAVYVQETYKDFEISQWHKELYRQAKEGLDFSQRRLQVYLEGLVE